MTIEAASGAERGGRRDPDVRRRYADGDRVVGRATSYGFHIIAGWFDRSEDEAVLAWADEADRIQSAYGINYEHLIELKLKWDPSNLFNSNYNVAVT